MTNKALLVTVAVVIGFPLAALALPKQATNRNRSGSRTSKASGTKSRAVASTSKAALDLPTPPPGERPSSRSISALRPPVRKKFEAFIAMAAKEGIELLVINTRRSCKHQNDLYEQGRTKPGKIVTNAKCGQSDHQVDSAGDVVEKKNGKLLWENPNWEKIGRLGERAGLKWGGRWKSFKDRPHFYDRAGKTTAQLWREMRGSTA